ncbi:hypothetical protein PPERSA_09499 [Pseudocohnilembus persalinus]|uniref:mRNA (guanine-N(7))-methyltransferase n=1 Tax=Pseudocohnilembus persalinus TaxID=266149 RepID=A0A0V0QFB9_PSEPJ|nr:hypothetical protein PPERSA_09499 [Pseudocohnilembus persalinus]|eukprot:KRX00893.1 hypothetical protein PPERSA_09499 [Pseudocohnilembus persalinus]
MLKELAQKVEDNGETYYRYINKYFGLQTKKLDFHKEKIHGVEYGFFLAESVGKKQGDKITFVPEYLIYLDEFIKQMEEQGMQVVENDNFLDFYKKQRNQYSQQLLSIFSHFEQTSDQIDEDQWDCIHCYRVLVFKKYKGKEQDQKQREYDIEQHSEVRVKYIKQSIQEKQQFFLNKEQHKKQQQNALSNNTTNVNGNGNINGTFSDSDEEEIKCSANEKQISVN